ncbi:uncharacterized protein UV8b_01141 [Ustilaginoidea virens]|uniref:FAR-17a/AIG1-like protein n=1 Tax=Ustilaginoidea virens TaxID=1159556 RepID=A0A8E5HK27_USTVR|nr:uncharacterized protein UV8b_01141 [Ustilaginoidea virens]QUC16900.1 hypothetical protein UV8b_01141 [Ustilaginoidea virens]
MAVSCPAVFALSSRPWDPSRRFETSWLLPPWALFACRALISLYVFTTLFFVLGYLCAHPSAGACAAARRSFSYFTVLTYWGLGFYFLFAAVHTLTYARRGRPLLDAFPRPLQALHSLLYTTVVTLPWLVTVVYWGVLHKGPWFAADFEAWRNVSQHALNAAFALFEILVPRTDPPPCLHLLWLLAILLAYLALAFLTLATQGWYTYSFLDHDAVRGRGVVAAYVLGIAVGIAVTFGVVYALIWLRRWLTEAKMGMKGKFVEAHGACDVEMRANEQKDDGQAFS